MLLLPPSWWLNFKESIRYIFIPLHTSFLPFKPIQSIVSVPGKSLFQSIAPLVLWLHCNFYSRICNWRHYLVKATKHKAYPYTWHYQTTDIIHINTFKQLYYQAFISIICHRIFNWSIFNHSTVILSTFLLYFDDNKFLEYLDFSSDHGTSHLP